MLKYLVAIIDKNAPSFCYYKNKNTQTGSHELIPLDTLKSVLNFALSKRLSINFLGINSSLPDAYRKEINNFKNHVRFIPVQEDDGKPDTILILNSRDKDIIKNMKDSSFRNIILRLEKKHLNEFLPLVRPLLYKCKRLNLCLLDIHSYKKDDFKTYKSQLDEIGEILVSEYKAGHPVELNFLTDRMLLQEMKNCNAGIEHITAGPDGCFYICPGFYHNVENSAVGNLKDGIKILNRQLLQLDHAPICTICDAYQCKRCIYLNKQSTLEVNTPSYQQCALSHLERDTSRIMLEQLKNIEPFKTMEPIAELDYIDPLLVLTGKVKKKKPEGIPGKKNPGTLSPAQQKKTNPIRKKAGKQVNKQKSINKQVNNELDTESVKGLLLEILKTQKQILAVLEKERGGSK